MNHHTPAMEVCTLVSAATHVPLIVVIHYAKQFREDAEFDRMTQLLTEFYKYEIDDTDN